MMASDAHVKYVKMLKIWERSLMLVVVMVSVRNGRILNRTRSVPASGSEGSKGGRIT